MCFGGGSDTQQDQPQQPQQPEVQYVSYPAYNPYQQYAANYPTGADALLGQATGGQQQNSPGSAPTGGWAGAGNAGVVPGAASQLLRMRQSPQYLWS
jgi:hypothetical protein